MAFWTSKEPGVLPKWIFWWYALQVPVLFFETVLENMDRPYVFRTASVGAVWAFLMAISARRNEIGVLIFWNVIAVIAGGYVLWASANVSSPGYLSSRGWSAEALVAAMAYASVWIWYLNRYRLKGGSASLPPSTLELNDPEEGVAATADRLVASVETDNAPNDNYAIELKLFEEGDLDESLWAKHVVEAEGDADKAKWKYIKERVATAPARRLDEERLAEREVEANIRSINQARVDSFIEKEQAGRASKPGGMGWPLAGLAFLVFIVFVIGFG